MPGDSNAHVAQDVDVLYGVLEDQLMEHAVAEVPCIQSRWLRCQCP